MSAHRVSYVNIVLQTGLSTSVLTHRDVFKIKKGCSRHLGSSLSSNWPLKTAFPELHFRILLCFFIEKNSHRKPPVSALVVLKKLKTLPTAWSRALRFAYEKTVTLSSGLFSFQNKNCGSDSGSLFSLMARKLGACFDNCFQRIHI